MTALTVPAKSRATVTVSWAAKDNLGVTGYQIRTRLGTGAWSAAAAVSGTSHVLTLGAGTWTIGVRATDAAANWSPWRYIAVAVDAGLPDDDRPVPAVESSVRSTNGSFTASWSAQRQRRASRATSGDSAGTWTGPGRRRSRPPPGRAAFSLHAGSWYLDVRARDAVGNWSDWSEIRVVVPGRRPLLRLLVGHGPADRLVLLPWDGHDDEPGRFDAHDHLHGHRASTSSGPSARRTAGCGSRSTVRRGSSTPATSARSGRPPTTTGSCCSAGPCAPGTAHRDDHEPGHHPPADDRRRRPRLHALNRRR